MKNKTFYKPDGDAPIKAWLSKDAYYSDEGLVKQAENLAQLPFIFKHLAIMPDAHQGYGMPIGGVAALDGYISPNMVGVDIGCGMGAVKTSLTEIDTEMLKYILKKIRQAIPVGFKHHEHSQGDNLMPVYSGNLSWVIDDQYESATRQLGTLGGGNHFIEIQKGDDGYIWIMVHSGSRNIGFKVANHYNKIAVKMNEKYFSSIPKKHELAFLPLDSEQGGKYRHEMEYCIEFAFANRSLMIERIKYLFEMNVNGCTFADTINIAHNYAAMENHYGKNVMVHRKGATRAREGEIGIVPGSQGTKSYIVKGLGNPESFQSCSHGAGRVMGRKEATRKLSLEDEQKHLDDLGVIHNIRSKSDLDEAPGAYKDIHMVMNNQSDLVSIGVELTPLGVIKG